jgi:hypothetical protein
MPIAQRIQNALRDNSIANIGAVVQAKLNNFQETNSINSIMIRVGGSIA